jgi:hypothetical protein
MMQAGAFETAIGLLEPLANAPHRGSASETAQTLMERARAGQPPLDDAALEAAADEAPAPPPEPAPEPETAPPEPGTGPVPSEPAPVA